jgi:hypothetical protein
LHWLELQLDGIATLILCFFFPFGLLSTSFPRPLRLVVSSSLSQLLDNMSVRVVARVRPLLPKELDKDVIVRVDSTEDGRPPNVVKIPSPKNEAEEFSFTFNGVYDQATTQEELFNAEGMSPCVLLSIQSAY